MHSRYLVVSTLQGTHKRRPIVRRSWWRHQMETFSALLAICAGNSRVPGEFRAQRPVTRGFDIYYDLCLNKRLSKQSWAWWFETLSRTLLRLCNVRTRYVLSYVSAESEQTNFKLFSYCMRYHDIYDRDISRVENSWVKLDLYKLQNSTLLC